ncbi:tetratricopeptide repeat protein [Treponema sp.]|uniref:tetratricopeptide repeat protein n=1 Tax=Treponema sp. TaxID=166 RepID=UPI00257CE525|nr:tetratricopeptide repeat protein [Treponema sp.]MBE6353274.1 tetratricopeptide repeat protein [Treponema sp.]
MTYLIAGVVVISLIAVLMLIFGKKGGGISAGGSGEHKNQAQIIRLANKKLAKDPYDPEGLFPIGDIYFSKQLWDKAFPVYMQLSKLPREKLTEEEYFLVLLRCGICAVHQNKFQEAVMSLSEAYNLNSRNFEVNYYLGLACFKSQQYEKAIPCFKKALIAKSDAEGVYFYLGQALYFTKKYRDSLPCFKKALDEDPSNKEALYDMADAMTEEGHGEKAIKVFMHLRPDPVYGSKSCLHAGVYHRKIGDNETAIQDFEIGLKHENALPEIKLEIEYNLAQVYFEKNQVAKGLTLLKTIRNLNSNYKDVNALISRYQELSQNSNLQIYLSAGSSDFVTLCRKFIAARYKNARVKIQDINVGPVFTDIVADVSTLKWSNVEVYRFFRTSGSTGELYVREFHGHIQDIKADRGFCVSAGTFTEEGRKYTEGRPIDLIEKTELVKVLKVISI